MAPIQAVGTSDEGRGQTAPSLSRPVDAARVVGSSSSANPYATIVADPPWTYGRADSRQVSAPGSAGRQRRVEKHIGYETLSTADIAAFAVGEAAAEDCRLFLWATSHHLPDAFDVCRAWGFSYRQMLIWKKTGRPTPLGGSVAPNHAEFLLVAIKGAPPVMTKLPSSVIEAPRQARHSRKPECVMDAIEQVSPGPYLELFARRERLGWDTWGDESANSSGLSLERAA